MKNHSKISTCRECFFHSSSLFKSLTEEQLDKLNYEKSCQHFRRGDIIYREGNKATGCYCVNDGIIKVFKTGVEGKEQIIMFAQKGDIIGYRSVISNEPFCTTAKVHEDANLCFIPAEFLLELVQKNHSFSLNMLKLACKELGEANSFLTDIAQRSVKERLAEVILLIRRTFGTDADGFIKLVLTREELANIVGTATESVIRQLSEFKNNKVIEIRGRKIKVLQPNLLERYANL